MKSSYKLLVPTIAAWFCLSISFAQKPIIYINGSSTVNSTLFEPLKDEIEKKANVTLEITVRGSINGLRDLVLDRCDIAMISGTLQTLADNLNDLVPNFIRLDQYTETKLGISSVVFIVNKKNPIDYLSSNDLRRICIGDVLNWKAFGGKDSRIIFFTMERGDGIRTVVQDELLKGDFFGVYTTVLRNSDVMNDLVAHLPEAIGTNNVHRTNDSVKILKTDITLTQPFILVSKVDAKPEVKELIEIVKKLAEEKLSTQSKTK